MMIRTGTLRIPFRENERTARLNFLYGRDLFEGQLPAVYVPDPVLPEWIDVKIPDHDG